MEAPAMANEFPAMKRMIQAHHGPQPDSFAPSPKLPGVPVELGQALDSPLPLYDIDEGIDVVGFEGLVDLVSVRRAVIDVAR